MICFFCGDRFGLPQIHSDCPGVCSKKECNNKADDKEQWALFLAAKLEFNQQEAKNGNKKPDVRAS